MTMYAVICEDQEYDTYHLVGIYSTLDNARYGIFEDVNDKHRECEFDDLMDDIDFNKITQDFIKSERWEFAIGQYIYDIDESYVD